MTHNEKVLITGGAGFIGSNLANRLLNKGFHVTIYDNFSRSGCEQNVAWLRETHDPDALDVIQADVTDFDALKRAAEGINRFYHLAGQVAVTTSVVNPRQDFENNALGTFNALEAARLVSDNPIFIFASTNKVYGSMEDIQVVERNTRYEYIDLPLGIPETQPLDFHSPYGCSKGSGDQYARDYFRIYGLRTVVMRQSCIYGFRQYGIEDQGWVAWFVIAALKLRPITIYGNGKQVRDILFVEDLLDAYEAAITNINRTAGQVFNIGGGSTNTISVWVEFCPMLEKLLGRSISVQYSNWRPGDQPVYVSDIRKAEKILNWHPRVSVKEGIPLLFYWIRDHQDLFSHM